jgi:hypothetical protein
MYYVTVSAHIQIFEKLNKTREIEQNVVIVIETVITLENATGNSNSNWDITICILFTFYYVGTISDYMENPRSTFF